MIIEIDDDLFKKVKGIVKKRNLAVYEQLEQVLPISNLQDNSLLKARKVKTQRIKQSIKETIKSLYDEDMKPTKYQIKKRTGVAYVTINKYYDDIIAEVQNEH